MIIGLFVLELYFCIKTIYMKKYSLIFLISILAACNGDKDQNAQVELKKDEPLTQSKNSELFNTQFDNFLNSYFHLKDALVLTNDTMAITSAQLLKVNADSLKLNELKADKSIIEMAIGYQESISAEAAALQGEKDIEGKRKSFQVISDNLYDLVRTVRFDKKIIYHQFCPMAFNDQGAYWLSPNKDIKNPYFGKKMLTCGEIKDSVDFRGK